MPPYLPPDPSAVRQLEALSLLRRQCVGCENEVFPPNNSKAGAKHCTRSSVNTRAPPASSCPVQQGDSRGEEVPRDPHPAQPLSTLFPLPSVGSFRDLREQHFIPGQASSVLQQEEKEPSNAQINCLCSPQLQSASPAESSRLGEGNQSSALL